MGDGEGHVSPADDNNNNVDASSNDADDNCDDNATSSSICDSSFNGYAALAELEEEDWGDLLDIQEIASQHGEKWRKGKLRYPRKDWNEYEDLLVSNANFYIRFRMSKKHFDYLVDDIRDCITVDYLKSLISTKGNTPPPLRLSQRLVFKVWGKDTTKLHLRIYLVTRTLQ